MTSRTYIFPSHTLHIEKQAQTIKTFTEKELLQDSEKVALKKDHTGSLIENQEHNFESTSEKSLKQIIARQLEQIQSNNKTLSALDEKSAAQKNIIAKQRADIAEDKKKAIEVAAKNTTAAEEKLKLQGTTIIAAAQKEADELLKEAQTKGQTILDNINAERKAIEEQFKKEAYDEGFAKGNTDSQRESTQLHTMVRKILSEIIAERSRLVERSEQHIIELCLLMVRKIVKEISAKDRQVATRNIRAALMRAQGLHNIEIHLNTLDWDLAEKNKNHLQQLVADLDTIKIIEDPSIEAGGCLITSDTGNVDARLSKQIYELELAIQDHSPIQTMPPQQGP